MSDPVLTTNSGGLLGTGLNLLPQFAQYQALYTQYRINWVQYTIVPQWNSFDPNVTGAISMPRIAYSIQNSGSDVATPPTSELNVLTDNGAKMRMLDRPLKIFHRPVAAVGLALSAGGFNTSSKQGQWFDILAGNVAHGWINYWITGGVATALTFKCYAKVSFTLKDPR